MAITPMQYDPTCHRFLPSPFALQPPSSLHSPAAAPRPQPFSTASPPSSALPPSTQDHSLPQNALHPLLLQPNYSLEANSHP